MRYPNVLAVTALLLELLVTVIAPVEAKAAIANVSAEPAATTTIQAPSRANQDRQPNIILIFADDLGYGDIGAYGSQTIKTPNIDRMAAEGAKFDEFYAASPVCTPSRAGLLTGRYPIRQGIHGVFAPESLQGMDPEEITIAEMLKEVGYTTGLVGKWHLGHHEKFMPWNQGFDEFFGLPYSNDMGGLYYFRNQEVLFDEIDQRYLTRTYTEEALKFIDKHRQQPFFLYLAHNMPHVPIYASPEFEGKSAGGLYGDVVEELDWSVGQILKRLEEQELSENTLVIFTSDNGPWLVMGDDGGSAGPLRMGKQYTFEGGMRVPAVAYWPGHIPAATQPEGFATMMDWLPTFATLTGASIPSDRAIDGEDISGLLTGSARKEKQELFYYMDGELLAYRSGDWKLKLPFKGRMGWLSFLNPGFSRGHGMLLFNLKNDPGERHNLADQEADRVKQMLTEIEAFKKSLGQLPAAKKMGKNMDRSPYISMISSMLLKMLLLVVVVLVLFWFLVRQFKLRHGKASNNG